MPLLKELGNLPDLLPSDSLISRSPLWNRNADSITELDISLFIAANREKNYSKALREVHLIIDAGIEGLICGELDIADFTSYEYPRAAFTVTELVEWLSPVPLARRKAILFSLEMRMHPRDVIALEWGKVSELTLTPIAFELVTTSLRHIKLKYVFWDYLSNGSAAPLFGLAETVMEVSQGLGYEALQRLYDRMILIDSNAELEGFMSALQALDDKVYVPAP